MTQRPTALVTGASSGIGAAIARKLAARGHDCVLAARRVERMEALAREIETAHGTRVHVVAADLGVRGGAEALVTAVAALGVTVDVLVNNAGAGVYGPFVSQDAARVSQMIELNLVSLTTLTHHYGREMAVRKRGRVMQIASVAAYQPSPLYAGYAATKAYVLFLSEAVNHELRGTGVTVTTVCPGLTATEFHEAAEHLKPKWMDFTQMTADEVAETGVRAMLAGRAVVTPGVMNKLTAVLVKFLPRALVVALAERTMRDHREPVAVRAPRG